MATPEIFEVALKLAPQIPRCMSADAGRWEIVDNAIKCKCQKVQFFTPYYNQEMIDRARAHGMICNFFFSDSPEDVPRLFEMGIDTILTNDYHLVAKAAEKYIANRRKK
jgi:glycerophosphoryl diester phosphodiesterase